MLGSVSLNNKRMYIILLKLYLFITTSYKCYYTTHVYMLIWANMYCKYLYMYISETSDAASQVQSDNSNKNNDNNSSYYTNNDNYHYYFNYKHS